MGCMADYDKEIINPDLIEEINVRFGKFYKFPSDGIEK